MVKGLGRGSSCRGGTLNRPLLRRLMYAGQLSVSFFFFFLAIRLKSKCQEQDGSRWRWRGRGAGSGQNVRPGAASTGGRRVVSSNTRRHDPPTHVHGQNTRRVGGPRPRHTRPLPPGPLALSGGTPLAPQQVFSEGGHQRGNVFLLHSPSLKLFYFL